MAQTREKKNTRFTVIKLLYLQTQANYMTVENAKLNAVGYAIYPSELDKFHAEFPDIDMAEFEAFLKTVDALKGAKKPGERKGGTSTTLNTPEHLTEIGIAVDKVVETVGYVNQVKALIKQINANLPKPYYCAFAIPKRVVKVKKEKVTK